MKLNKIIRSIGTLAICLTLLSACTPTAPKEAQPAEGTQPATEANSAEPAQAEPTAKMGGYKIAYVNYSLGNSMRVQMQEEFIARAEQYKADGVISEYFITNSNNDISKQISDVKDMITKGVDAICITAASPTALAPVVEEAMNAGIKVVSFDNWVETDNQTSVVRIDEMEFGRIGARFIAKELNGKGDIIALNGISGTAVNDARWKGAEEILKDYPDIKVVGSAYGDWDYAKGKAATESLLSAYKKIDAVWSQGGAMTQGAIDAFNAAGRPLVPMVGEANNGFMRVWKENMDKGLVCAAPGFSSAMAKKALETAVDALQGKPVEKEIVMPIESITIDQFDKLYNPDLSDSFWVLTDLSKDRLEKLYKK